MKYAIESGPGEHTVEIDRVTSGPEGIDVVARVDGRPYSLRLEEVEPRVFWFVDGARSREATVAPAEGGQVTVELDGRRLELRVLDRRTRLARARRGPAEGGTVEIRAPMPGRVVRVLVADGALVADGQAVVVIEAMKMQNEVKSPRAGTVRVRVNDGQAVNAGEVVFSVE
jgi:biotin carboxyl carrier protein